MEFENLKKLGANEFVLSKIKDLDFNLYKPARVFSQHSGIYRIAFSPTETHLSFLSGKLKKSVKSKNEIPVTGDWVIAENKKYEKFPILKVIERYSKIERDYPEKKYKQVLAANIDIAFLVISADKGNFSEEKIKNYFNLIIKNKTDYVLIINKIDLAENKDFVLKTAENIGAEKEKIVLLDSLKKIGYESLNKWLIPFKTSVLIGHSGAGKSTIINNLYGKPIKKTKEINMKNMKGKQTTTVRDMIILNNNHIIMDIPGISFADNSSDINKFEIIRAISHKCKFYDCKHFTEPDCAVKEAVRNNEIDPKLYEEYLIFLKNGKI